MAEGPAAEPGSDERADGGPTIVDHGRRHDLLIASLLDRHAASEERSEAEGLLASCPACARLHADLVSLAAATRDSAVPARPRDFRLTPEDAARLGSTAVQAREPRGAASRLTGEMHVPNADHHAHDELLVAGLLDRSTDTVERQRAEALIAACDDCATLLRDLVAIREATRALPTPPRRREFTLSAEDARRIRRFGWRRLVAAFGSPRDAFSRPLAIGLTTLGLAGLLVSTIPGAFPGATGSPASAPAIGQAVGGGGAGSASLEGSKEAPAASAAPSAPPVAAAVPAPSAAPTDGAARTAPSSEPAPSGEAFDTFAGTAAASAGAVAIASAPGTSVQRDGADRLAATSIEQQASSADRFALIGFASLVLVVGVGLFALRWVARRV